MLWPAGSVRRQKPQSSAMRTAGVGLTNCLANKASQSEAGGWDAEWLAPGAEGLQCKL